MNSTPRRPSKRLTKIEREAIRIVVEERLAGDVEGFFRDACGEPPELAEKHAAALESASLKI